MYEIAPMRDERGAAVGIKSVRVTRRSQAATSANVQLRQGQDLADAESDDYSGLFPPVLSLAPDGQSHPFGQVNAAYTLPGAEQLPFPTATPHFAVRALQPDDAEGQSRDLWVEVEVRLERRVRLGGLCFAGLPFLLYSVDAAGRVSSNHGVPREVRVTLPHTASGFIDGERHWSHQMLVAHGGVHMMALDGVPADRFVLRLSDWPALTVGLRCAEHKQPPYHRLSKVEQFGFVLPFVIVYEHRDGVRYRPDVPGGLLACVKRPALTMEGRFCPDADAPPLNVEPMADHIIAISNPEDAALLASAASLFGQRRVLTVGGQSWQEHFISEAVEPGESIWLIVEQTETHERTLAGLRLQPMPKPQFNTMPTPPCDVDVYALDLPTGVSPVMAANGGGVEKYADRIGGGTYQGGVADQIIDFDRPSLSRRFAVVFRNTGRQTGQLQLLGLRLVQSAHVAVSPKAGHHLEINSVGYRVIGSGLADDYSRLGSSGCGFRVEIAQGGEPTRVLLEARSLLDLVGKGGGRLIGNLRRLETVKDVTRDETTTHKGSYQIQESETNRSGWRQDRTGAGVSWQGDGRSLENIGAFDSYGSSESRTRTRLVGHEGPESIAAAFKELADVVFDNPAWLPDNIFAEEPELKRPDDNGFDWNENIWKCFANTNFWVDVVSNYTASPLDPATNITAIVQEIGEAVENLKAWIENPLSLPNGPDIEALLSLGNLTPLVLLNGLSAGLSVGVQVGAGGSLTFGSSLPLLPGLVRTSTTGSTGNIAHQGHKTGCSYSQFLNHAYDRAKTVTQYGDGLMLRTMVRYPDQPGTEKERRAGVEVFWEGRGADIVTGSLPVGVQLPALAAEMYESADREVRVVFYGSPVDDASIEVWFSGREIAIREDY